MCWDLILTHFKMPLLACFVNQQMTSLIRKTDTIFLLAPNSDSLRMQEDIFYQSAKCWAPKNWCFWTVVLEKTLENPLDWKEIQPVHPKGNQSWIFIGRTDVEAETPIIWSPDAKNWLTGKDSDAGRDWGQEEKGTTEDEVVGWHHRLNGHEFEQTPGAGDGQGGPACCSPWGSKESDMTERLNWKSCTFPKGLCVREQSLLKERLTWQFLKPTCPSVWKIWMKSTVLVGEKEIQDC